MKTVLGFLLFSLGCLTISAQLVQKTYKLRVTEDVTLERGSRNFNSLEFLIVGTHPYYPLKRSLMKFDNIPSECLLPLRATLHIFFIYAHKASFMSSTRVPAVTRYITAHTVLKSWTESQATSTKRFSNIFWDNQWLNLGTDASVNGLHITAVTAVPGKKWYQLNVTPQARDWKFGSNYGLLLRDTHETTQGRDFRFASDAHSDSQKHAYITLQCLATK